MGAGTSVVRRAGIVAKIDVAETGQAEEGAKEEVAVVAGPMEGREGEVCSVARCSVTLPLPRG